MPCYRWGWDASSSSYKWIMSDGALFKRWDGSKWVDTYPKRFDGSSWVDAEKEKVPVELKLTGDRTYGLRAQVRLLSLKSGLEHPTSPHTYYVKLYGMGSSSHYFPAPRVYTLTFSSDTRKSNIVTLGFDYEYQECDFWLETRNGIVTDRYSAWFESMSNIMPTRIRWFFSYRTSEEGGIV